MIIHDEKNYASITSHTAKRGFTLVEVLVTALIVAILAAIAIPNYLGYINSQKQDTVSNLAETAAAAADVFYRKTATAPTQISQLNLRYDNTKYTIQILTDSVKVFMTAQTNFTKTVAFK